MFHLLYHVKKDHRNTEFIFKSVHSFLKQIGYMNLEITAHFIFSCSYAFILNSDFLQGISKKMRKIYNFIKPLNKVKGGSTLPSLEQPKQLPAKGQETASKTSQGKSKSLSHISWVSKNNFWILRNIWQNIIFLPSSMEWSPKYLFKFLKQG